MGVNTFHYFFPAPFLFPAPLLFSPFPCFFSFHFVFPTSFLKQILNLLELLVVRPATSWMNQTASNATHEQIIINLELDGAA